MRYYKFDDGSDFNSPAMLRKPLISNRTGVEAAISNVLIIQDDDLSFCRSAELPCSPAVFLRLSWNYAGVLTSLQFFSNFPKRESSFP